MILTQKQLESEIDIRRIINEKSVIIYYQPIASIHQNKIAGYEALARGIDPITQALISPLTLFALARENGLVNDLDVLCQQKALESFSSIHDYQNAILFLNIDHSVIQNELETNSIYHLAQFWGINPENIALEINEQYCVDMNLIKSFVLKYKSLGFMISLDDVGAGFSNLDRIPLLKPDIIKIDKGLISNIDKHFYKQQVVKMIVMLAENIGALVVSEGTERMEEIVTVFKYGSQFIQGYYFSKPCPPLELNIINCEKVIHQIVYHQKKNLSDELLKKRYYNLFIKNHFLEIKKLLTDRSIETIDQHIKKAIITYPEIECAYIVDLLGTQKSNTIFGNQIDSIHRKKLFNPHKKGDDVTLKKYFYNLKTTGQNIWISDEYLSLATGNKCITISGYISIKGLSFILCLDIESNITHNIQQIELSK